MHPNSESHVVLCVDSKKFRFDRILEFILDNYYIEYITILPIVVRYLLEDLTWQVSFSAKILVR